MADTKAKIIYTELLKEDLVIIRISPYKWNAKIPKLVNSLTIGLPVAAENKIVKRAYSHCIPC